MDLCSVRLVFARLPKHINLISKQIILNIVFHERLLLIIQRYWKSEIQNVSELLKYVVVKMRLFASAFLLF